MKQRQIYITSFDKKRLDELIKVASRLGEHSKNHLDEIIAELSRAKIVEPEKIPADVVTMNSKIVLHDLDTADEDTYTVVFPAEANVDTGAISVLAPIGTAVLGYRVGQTVEWVVPSGKRRIRIERIEYQPEAAGDFDR